jgi:glycine/D-amino acid oxidase-like deaminating enzyme/nitrite reductase/ring-hydroxylating ferredoxin subunit
MALPGQPECCWAATAPATSYPPLIAPTDAPVVVAGAGIVGLTIAYRLAKAGLSVLVLESLRIGRQVTGRSTAKITSQHSLIYRHLTDSFGLDHAKLYADANRTAASQIRSWIGEFGIACDLQQKDAYSFTCDPARRGEIEREAEAARKLGFDARVLDRAPLPFATAGALMFPGEAQFNPTRYLVGLAAAAEKAGARIFENTRVTEVESDGRWRVTTERGVINTDHIVLATSIPFTGPLDEDYGQRMQPSCHAAIAYRVPMESLIEGMFISIDAPTHSLRTGRDNEGALLVALGPRFNTGQDSNVARQFEDLDQWVRERLPVGEAVWRWVNEDYYTADRLPFVALENGFYFATGFNGWGISNGTAAGLLIAHRILGRTNPWAAIYDPKRSYPDDFNSGGDTQSAVDSVDRIATGEGGVIERGEEKIAVWRDNEGKLHAYSAACTHEGCIVTWNNAESTWDCPCHGSMFDAEGRVKHGPAAEPLSPVKL